MRDSVLALAGSQLLVLFFTPVVKVKTEYKEH
jgi:hypothetical protein